MTTDKKVQDYWHIITEFLHTEGNDWICARSLTICLEKDNIVDLEKNQVEMKILISAPRLLTRAQVRTYAHLMCEELACRFVSKKPGESWSEAIDDSMRKKLELSTKADRYV